MDDDLICANCQCPMPLGQSPLSDTSLTVGYCSEECENEALGICDADFEYGPDDEWCWHVTDDLSEVI